MRCVYVCVCIVCVDLLPHRSTHRQAGELPSLALGARSPLGLPSVLSLLAHVAAGLTLLRLHLPCNAFVAHRLRSVGGERAWLTN